jgi:hypothetical protein
MNCLELFLFEISRILGMEVLVMYSAVRTPCITVAHQSREPIELDAVFR